MAQWENFSGQTVPIFTDQTTQLGLDAQQWQNTTSVFPREVYGALPRGTVLNNQYWIEGAKDHYFHMEYEAIDLKNMQRVTVVEYFCREIAHRLEDGSIETWDGEEYRKGWEWFEKHIYYGMETCGIYNPFRYNGTIYAVMKHKKYITLEEFVRNNKSGQMMLPAAVGLLNDAMDELSRLHSAGFVHRWLGMDTILWSDGEIFLDCFGNVAKYPDRNDDPIADRGSEPRRFFALRYPWCYPIEYMAEKQPLLPASAVYVLSAIITWLVSGQNPPTSMDRIMENTWKVPRNVWLTEPVCQVLEKGMAIRQADRYQSVEEFRWNLNRVMYSYHKL